MAEEAFGENSPLEDLLIMLENYLNQLLTESPESVIGRESSFFNRSNGADPKSLILFGAGKLGRKTLFALKNLDIEPLAFADNNSELWNKRIEGLIVYSPNDAVNIFGKTASFLVTIRHPGFTFEQAKSQLFELGCKKIFPIISLYWSFPQYFLPHYFIDLPHKIRENENDIRKAFYLFEDEFSKKEFLAQLKYRLWLNQDRMQLPNHENQYFPEGLNLLLPEDVFVDCGAYDGDTVKTFLFKTTSFNHVIAYEPDPYNFTKLNEFILGLAPEVQSKITVRQNAVGARHEKVRFTADGTVEAAITTDKGIDVECVTLDETLQNWTPTYIKMDIEGSEIDALLGAQNIIRRHKPALAICLYHRPDHIWRIPLYLHSLQKDYHFFLYPHDYEGWDLVCYAIPENRLKV